MKNLIIRMAKIEDLNQLVQLRLLMQTEINNISQSSIPEDYELKIRNYFESSISAKKYFSAVAVLENRIIGTAGVCFYEKPPSIFGGTGIVGYVTNVFTEKEFRNQGVGAKMMMALVSLAQEMKADKLHLGATESGFSIYKSVGFKEPRFVNLECKIQPMK